jgi:hypothetical protein
MAPRPGFVVSQAANSALLQKKHWPQAMVKGTTTPSPFFSRVTPQPASSTTPMNSVPEDVPRLHVWNLAAEDVLVRAAAGVAVTRRTTSSSCSSTGSGAVCTLTFREDW